VDQYDSFNDFFCRELKPDARPVDQSEGSIVFPADGRHFGWQSLGQEQGVFVKGQKWNLWQLLDGRKDLVDRFSGGTLVLSRLDWRHGGGMLVDREGPVFGEPDCLAAASRLPDRQQAMPDTSGD
jgi:hypothetical protein